MIKMMLYSPLTAEFFPTEVYGNDELMNYRGSFELDGEDLVEYAPSCSKLALHMPIWPRISGINGLYTLFPV